MLFISGLMAFWVYAGPILAGAGVSPERISLAINAAIAAQLVGGVAAIILANRAAPAKAWAGGALAMAMAPVGILFVPTPMVIIFGLFVFGFAWMFTPPFQMPVIQSVDQTGRGGMLVGSAQLIGATLGPLAAAMAVSMAGQKAAASLAIIFLIGSCAA